MTDNSVFCEKRGQAFWITINRPDKRNALNAGVIAGIARGYRDAHDDKDVRSHRADRRGRQGVLRRRRSAEQRRGVLDGFLAVRMSTTPTCCGCRRTRPSPRSRGSAASAWPAAWACCA